MVILGIIDLNYMISGNRTESWKALENNFTQGSKPWLDKATQVNDIFELFEQSVASLTLTAHRFSFKCLIVPVKSVVCGKDVFR